MGNNFNLALYDEFLEAYSEVKEIRALKAELMGNNLVGEQSHNNAINLDDGETLEFYHTGARGREITVDSVDDRMLKFFYPHQEPTVVKETTPNYIVEKSLKDLDTRPTGIFKPMSSYMIETTLENHGRGESNV